MVDYFLHTNSLCFSPIEYIFRLIFSFQALIWYMSKISGGKRSITDNVYVLFTYLIHLKNYLFACFFACVSLYCS